MAERDGAAACHGAISLGPRRHCPSQPSNGHGPIKIATRARRPKPLRRRCGTNRQPKRRSGTSADQRPPEGPGVIVVLLGPPAPEPLARRRASFPGGTDEDGRLYIVMEYLAGGVAR
jgi:hypothetical protein